MTRRDKTSKELQAEKAAEQNAGNLYRAKRLLGTINTFEQTLRGFPRSFTRKLLANLQDHKTWLIAEDPIFQTAAAELFIEVPNTVDNSNSCNMQAYDPR